MAEKAARSSPVSDDQAHVLWLRYLDIAGDHAMTVRLEAMRKVARAGRALAARADGTPTAAPLIVAAEAAAAARAGGDERGWREEWVRRMVQLAVTWQEASSTEGVVSVLTLTDRIIEDLKAAGAWPWAKRDAAPAAALAQPLKYLDDDVPAAGMQAVRGDEHVVWHRLLEMSGDGQVAVRLAAVHAASQSSSQTMVATGNGCCPCFPTMIVAEGAVAAQEGKSEAEWHEEWTRRCVQIVTQWPGPETIDIVAALFVCTPKVVEELRYARVWPWAGVRRAAAGPAR